MAFGVVSNITEFSDDILLNIFSYLTSWDLLNTLDTCVRFNKVGRDHSLWKRGDFSERSLTAAQITRRVLTCLQSCTKCLNFKGQKRKDIGQNSRWKSDLLNSTLLKSIGKKCPHLQELSISEAVVDAKKCKIASFEQVGGLTILSIVDCEFIRLPSCQNEGSYFRNMQTILPKLERLEISKCSWITDYDLMVLSKLDSLKTLILKCDVRIGVTMVYLSLSFRFGFKNLEELDLRGTGLQNNDMQVIVQSGKLKSLSIGPVGSRVKRLRPECDQRFNLVMSDPQRRDEPKQQVVVITMKANGPDWHAANDDELDEMGLHWIRNGLNQRKKTPEKEEHFFFGKGGKIVGKSDIGGECSKTSDAKLGKKSDDQESSKSSENPKKRKLNDCENDGDEQIKKQQKTKYSDDDDLDSADSDNEFLPDTEEHDLPDILLADKMIDAFEDHSFNLQTLRLAGCAVSNAGLMKLVKSATSLRYLDVSNTLITNRGIEETQLLLPECQIVSSTDMSSDR